MGSCAKGAKGDIKALNTELGYPLEEITQADVKGMGIQLSGTFKPCRACALGKAKKAGVSKMAIPYSAVEGKRQLIGSRYPSAASMGGRKHCLLIV